MSRKKRYWRWLVVVAVLAAGGGLGYRQWQKRRELANAPTYLPVKVAKGDILVAVQATGTVAPENRLVIKAPINGRIDSIAVEEGMAVKKNQVLAMMSSTDRAALLDMARAKGPEEVAHWEEVYRPTPIVAPLAGVIIQRSVEPGQVIATTDQVYSMSDHLICIAQVDETDIAKVHLGQDVVITLDAYAAQPVNGIVHLIAFDATTVNNVTIYNVQIQPAKVPDFMRSGMTASVKFKVDEHKGVLLVPAAAVRQAADGSFTVLEKKAGEGDDDGGRKPREVAVKTGLTDGKVVEILAGLSEGETIQQEVMKLPEAKGGSNPFGTQPKSPSKGR